MKTSFAKAKGLFSANIVLASTTGKRAKRSKAPPPQQNGVVVELQTFNPLYWKGGLSLLFLSLEIREESPDFIGMDTR